MEENSNAHSWLSEAKRLEREGELFRAYDAAMKGLAQHPSHVPLAHLAVLSLARSGATQLALAKFQELGLHRHMEDFEIHSLSARLFKDQGLKETGKAQLGFLRRAYHAYLVAYKHAKASRNRAAYYPGINAATVALLIGRRAKAQQLAHAIIRDLDVPFGGNSEYYELATRTEAYLVLGEFEEAKSAARGALAVAGGNYSAVATTARQLRLLCTALKVDPVWLAAFTPPSSIHYIGEVLADPALARHVARGELAALSAQIAARLLAANVGFGYGSLASGGDILCAEALLQHGARLNVVLPFNRSDFLQIFVKPAGDDWANRFEACLSQAESVKFATTDRFLQEHSLLTYCSELAMGIASNHAAHLGTAVEQVGVCLSHQSEICNAGFADSIATWAGLGRKQTIVSNSPSERIGSKRSLKQSSGSRITRAMLFGDLKGFSKLSDVQMPRFIDDIMGAFARVIEAHGSGVDLVNTWGDGIFLVFREAGLAAACALDLQEAMRSVDLKSLGLPETMGLRLGGHLGPVYSATDPISKRFNFYGTHVSRAARIEPVTPEGCLWVTEPFAAALDLFNCGQFSMNYVGKTEAAKHYGSMSMFLLSRPR